MPRNFWRSPPLMKIQRNSWPPRAEVQKELKSNPDYVPALMAQAALLAQHGEVKQATETYSDILRRLPDFAPAQKRLAALYAQDPSTVAAAYDLATKARKTLPDDPELGRASWPIELRKKGIPARHPVITGKRSETAARRRFSFLSGHVSAPKPDKRPKRRESLIKRWSPAFRNLSRPKQSAPSRISSGSEITILGTLLGVKAITGI